MCTPCPQALYLSWVVEARRNILAILQDMPSLRPPIDHLCELLPRLQARYYSIASSSKVSVLLAGTEAAEKPPQLHNAMVSLSAGDWIWGTCPGDTFCEGASFSYLCAREEGGYLNFHRVCRGSHTAASCALIPPPSLQPCSSLPVGLAFRAWKQGGILGVDENSLFCFVPEALRLLAIPREARWSCDESDGREKPHVGRAGRFDPLGEEQLSQC